MMQHKLALFGPYPQTMRLVCNGCFSCAGNEAIVRTYETLDDSAGDGASGLGRRMWPQ